MHYNLLFNGCSFTEGAELEGINRDYEYRRTHRFSHVVGELTGLTYANIAVAGSSNDRILRTTVEWFEEGNTCDHVIIQWTNRSRIEYLSEINIKSDTKKLPRYYDIFYTARRFYSPEGVSILNSYTNIQNNSNDQNNEDRCIYWMEKLLKDKCSFDYLKLRKETPFVSPDYLNIGTYHKYHTKSPITYIIDDILKNSRIFYCDPVPGYPQLKGGHPNRLGHRKIADYIINNFEYFQ